MKYINHGAQRVMVQFISILIFALPTFVMAQTSGGPVFPNPLGSTSDFPALLTALLEIVVALGIPILTLYLVYIGFMFASARGNEQKLTKAKDAFLWAVIGGGVLLGAKIIETLIRGTITNLGG